MRKSPFLLLLAGLALCTPHGAAAQNYPSDPVRLIVPFGAGGGLDIMTRPLAAKLAPLLGTTVLVENKPGANGNLGTEIVAGSAPDGATVLVTTNAPIAINPQLLTDEVRYNPVKDFEPVTLLSSLPFVLVVHPSVPAKTVEEFIALAKSKPGELDCGSSGVGGGAHLSLEMLKTRAGLDITHVPFKGSGPAMTALLGGHLDCMFVSILTVSSYNSNGQLRALAVTSPQRAPVLPDVPAVAELPGMDGFAADLWYGILVPNGTDAALVDKLYKATKQVLADPEFRKQFEPAGAILVGNTPAEFKKQIADDIVRWTDVIEKSGVKEQL